MPFVSGASPVILRTDPQWFIKRGIIWGLVFPLFLRVIGAGSFAWPFALVVALLWVAFRNSTITLDSEGFLYDSVVRRVAHAWVDVERFSVVEQRMYGFITISKSLGWNYSPAYKHYKRLAIPRTLARWVGTTDAMFKPVGFNVPGLVAVMNEHLAQARTATSGTPGPSF